MNLSATPLRTLQQQVGASLAWMRPAPSSQREQPRLISSIGGWFARRYAASDEGRLCITERVALGEKTYLSVAQVGGRRFLIANAPSTVSLLAELTQMESFAETLQDLQETPMPAPRKSRAKKAVREADRQ